LVVAVHPFQRHPSAQINDYTRAGTIDNSQALFDLYNQLSDREVFIIMAANSGTPAAAKILSWETETKI
jgi:site-specific DNA-adenine methylase